VDRLHRLIVPTVYADRPMQSAAMPLHQRTLGRTTRSRDSADSAAAQPNAAQLAEVIDALDTPLCVSDLDNGAILFANGPFTVCFGTPPDGGIASFERSFASAPSERFPAATLVDPDGRPSGVQIGEFHRAIDQQWYLVRAAAIPWEPRRLARLHAFVNITSRIESERFRQTQQERLLLTSRLMSVGELASTLAHELNQPLAAISNFVQGALRRLRSGSGASTELIEALEHAGLQAEHAARVVSRMRDFVRTREPQRQPTSIEGVVCAVARLMDPEAQKRGVSLSLDLPAALPPAFADRVMIEQVVLNLVKNALDAMDQTPAGRRHLLISACINSDEQIQVAVKDTGPGFPRDAEAQIFSPFFTTKPEGMGIGLSICRSIIEYHDGRLSFCGNPDGGATFSFTLPMAD